MMRYAQIKSGAKMHLVYEPGEGRDAGSIVRSGFLSAPICGAATPHGYRMTCNLPLANGCKNCRRVYQRRHS